MMFIVYFYRLGLNGPNFIYSFNLDLRAKREWGNISFSPIVVVVGGGVVV